MKTDERDLVAKAIRYLKDVYEEDTVSMSVTENAVEEGTGVLSVDCAVSVGGSESDWSKKFYFERNAVTKMTWRRR